MFHVDVYSIHIGLETRLLSHNLGVYNNAITKLHGAFWNGLRVPPPDAVMNWRIV